MAYNVYFICDKCGTDGVNWTNLTVSLSRAEKVARAYGWKIGKDGWICPKCQKKRREENKRDN